MDAAQVDQLLTRRLTLQRYVTSAVNQVQRSLGPLDTQLLRLLNDFAMSADERTLAAFASFRRSDAQANALRQAIREIIQTQQAITREYLGEQMAQLIEQETTALGRVMERDPAPMRGVISEPVNGQVFDDVIGTAFAAYAAQLVSQLAISARTASGSLALIVRGSRDQRYRDGVLSWRDNRQLRPRIDQLVNGVVTNAQVKAFKHYRIEQVRWLATLDYRTCPSCYTAEANSPYPIDKAPRAPMHPFCRCQLIPAVPGVTTERPFVRDDRSVADIPRGSRAGKVGTTRDTISAFFNRMSDAQRKAYMGPERAARWRSGQITDVKQLVDQITFEPLTLDELDAAA